MKKKMNRDEKIKYLIERLNASNIELPENQSILKELTIKEREYISAVTKSRVYYYDDEVSLVKNAEDKILEMVLPDGYNFSDLNKLNGLNIGAGGRPISEFIICLDFNRGDEATTQINGIVKNSILANANDLPFKDNSIDYVIALHILEHCAEPVHTLNEWLRVLKPGAKLGVIIPNWRYNWSASNDNDKYGHRWNTSPKSAEKLLKTHFNDLIVSMDTLPYKLSFDFVLKKPGIFKSFQPFYEKTGYEIASGLETDYYIFNSKVFVCE